MGNTASLAISTKPTSSTAPIDKNTPTSDVTVESTVNGGIRVVEVKEPAVGDPKLILGKFKDQAALEAAYTELESGKGKKIDETPAPVVTTNLTIESATKVLTDKGLNFQEFASQYAEAGALSSESYSKLFAKGITAQQIDSFLAAQAPIIAADKAKAETNAKEIKDSVGGAEEFTKLIDFAKTSVTPAEIASYNRALDAGDTVAAKLLLTNFKAQRDAKLGIEPTLNGGVPPTQGSNDVYQELGQYHAELRDPRYTKDAYFRSKVDAKLKRSKSLYT